MIIKNEQNKKIHIDPFKNLLKKLYNKKLLNLEGGLKHNTEYCEDSLIITTCNDGKIRFRGSLNPELSELTDYEIVLLLIQDEVLSYQIKRYIDCSFILIVYDKKLDGIKMYDLYRDDYLIESANDFNHLRSLAESFVKDMKSRYIIKLKEEIYFISSVNKGENK